MDHAMARNKFYQEHLCYEALNKEEVCYAKNEDLDKFSGTWWIFQLTG